MTNNNSQLTSEIYLRRLKHEGKRLPSDERSELVSGMRAHVAALESEGLAPDVMAARLAALGDPRRVVDDYLAMTNQVKPYRTKTVIAALVTAWLVALSGLASLFTGSLLSPISENLVILFLIANVLRSVGAIVLLVTTIVGSMWRRWTDGITALLILISANAIPALVLFNSVVLASGSAHTVAEVLLTLAITVLAACTAYWTLRLGRQHDRLRTAASVLGCAAAAMGLVIIAVSIARSDSVTAADGQLVVVNDTGSAASVTFCPHQNCHGAPTHTMQNHDHLTFAETSSSTTPDSVVVKQAGQPTKCALDMGGSGFPGDNAGEVVHLSAEANTQTCGADVQSMNGGPAPSDFLAPPGQMSADALGTAITYLEMSSGPGCGVSGALVAPGAHLHDELCGSMKIDQFRDVRPSAGGSSNGDAVVTAQVHLVTTGWVPWSLTMHHTSDGWRVAQSARS